MRSLELARSKREKSTRPNGERVPPRVFVGIALIPRRGDIRRHGMGREQVATIKIPRVFSFLQDPAGAMQTLERIRSIAGRNNIRHIEIDHSGCETLGLCASVVMDVSLMQAKRHRAKRVPLTISGKFSEQIGRAVNALMQSERDSASRWGSPESFLDAELEKRVRRADLLQGTSNWRERSPQRNIAAEALTTYFNSCLLSLGYELKKEGKKYLADLLTEVIGNASQEHGQNRWYTIGHWHEVKREGTLRGRQGRCHTSYL